MSDQNPHTVCIIGGGMSGLFTGALLAKNGYKVTVLEKNHIIGGGLQSFRRGDVIFNTGMQAFCGYGDEFALKHFIDYIGIDHKDLHFVPLDSDAQEIVWTDKEHAYMLPKTRKRYEEYLISQFPNDAKGIHQLLDAVYEIGSTFDYFWLHPMQLHPAAAKYGIITARQLIESCITDETLKRLLEYVGMHLGYNLSCLPATELGMILNLYIEGGWRIAGGNLSFAKQLAHFIEEMGGKVYNNAEVSKITAENRMVIRVQTADKQIFVADQYVCAIPPKAFLQITCGEVLRSTTYNRIMEFNNDSSCCICHIKLKPNSIRYRNNLIFIPTPAVDQSLPHYISMLTPPVTHQGEWADTVEILIFTRYGEYKQWENTISGRRGVEYEARKEQLAQRTIDYISQFYPELREAVDTVYVSTPLTVRDYYGNPTGAVYAQQGMFAPVKTKASNLFMTGQSVQYQGLFGTLTTSIAVAEIMMKKSLIEEIAKA
jgi:phytoene dehydrogenase-like protein